MSSESSPKKYKLIVANRFVKDLKKLDRGIQTRILNAIKKLEENPYIGEKVVAGETGNWRARIGDWRVRYDIKGQEVHLLRVRHRREVYRQN